MKKLFQKIRENKRIVLLVSAFVFLALVVLVSVFFDWTNVKIAQKEEKVAEKYRVALVGDNGVKETSYQAFDLIKKERADLFVQLGDFDYEDNSEKWKKALNANFASDFPIIFVAGNHDLKKWEEYKSTLLERQENKEGLRCEGELGVKNLCYFKDLKIVVSGIGTVEERDEGFVRDSLQKNDNANFEICAWHKNMKLMQTGDKKDDIGWQSFETCREEGAFVVMGHEHSYERTKSMTSFINQTMASPEEINNLVLKKGQSFAVVSGLGGYDVRPGKTELVQNPWWAKTFNKNDGAKDAVLFCDFEVGSPKAECFLKDTMGQVQDRFGIIKK